MPEHAAKSLGMNTYWIHIIRADSGGQVFTIALSGAERATFGSLLPTVKYPNWKRLSEAFSSIGIPVSILDKLRSNLESVGFDSLRGIALSEQDIVSLGFNTWSVEAGRKTVRPRYFAT